MRKTDIVLAIILSLLGLLGLLVVVPLQTSAGEEFGLSSAFFPNISLIALTGLSIILLIKRLVKHEPSGPNPLSSKSWFHLFVVIFLLFFSLGLIRFLGFIPGGIFLLLSLMLFMKERKIIILSTVSFGIPIGIYLLLWKLMNIPMP